MKSAMNEDAFMPTEEMVREALRTVEDPEVGMNVVDLGLVYGIEVCGADVSVRLTMTSPACPLGDVIVENVQAAIRKAAPGAGDIDVALVWDPPWNPSMMSEAARKRFGW
jgi:metal-sulfur cluster biosynthetic enzyme